MSSALTRCGALLCVSLCCSRSCRRPWKHCSSVTSDLCRCRSGSIRHTHTHNECLTAQQSRTALTSVSSSARVAAGSAAGSASCRLSSQTACGSARQRSRRHAAFTHSSCRRRRCSRERERRHAHTQLTHTHTHTHTHGQIYLFCLLSILRNKDTRRSLRTTACVLNQKILFTFMCRK